MLVLRISPGRALRVYGATLDQLKWATLTVAAVLALAYVMNLSGADAHDRQLDRRRGRHPRVPVADHRLARRRGDRLGHVVELAVRRAAGDRRPRRPGLDPTLLAAANSSGGVLGKMISPQNLAIGAAAVGLAGQEGELFRQVLGWSLLLLLIMCVLVYLQSTAVLSWMVV